MPPVYFSDNPDTIAAICTLDKGQHVAGKENENFIENKSYEENDSKSDLEVSSSRESTAQDGHSDGDGCVNSSDIDTTVYDGSMRHMQRSRTSFTAEQLRVLEEEYKTDGYLTRTRKMVLSKTLDLSENTIKVWFQNRRMKHKRRKTKLPDSLRTPYGKRLNPTHFSAIAELYNPYAMRAPELMPQAQVLYNPATYPYHLYVPFQSNCNCNEQSCNTFTPENQYFDQFMQSGISRVSHIQALQSQVLNCCSSCSITYMKEVANHKTGRQSQDSLQFNYNTALNSSSTPQESFPYFESSSPSRCSEVSSPSSSFTETIPYVSSSVPLPNVSSEIPQTIAAVRKLPSYDISIPQKECLSSSSVNKSSAISSTNVSSTSQNSKNTEKTNSKVKFFRPFEDN